MQHSAHLDLSNIQNKEHGVGVARTDEGGGEHSQRDWEGECLGWRHNMG